LSDVAKRIRIVGSSYRQLRGAKRSITDELTGGKQSKPFEYLRRSVPVCAINYHGMSIEIILG